MCDGLITTDDRQRSDAELRSPDRVLVRTEREGSPDELPCRSGRSPLSSSGWTARSRLRATRPRRRRGDGPAGRTPPPSRPSPAAAPRSGRPSPRPAGGRRTARSRRRSPSASRTSSGRTARTPGPRRRRQSRCLRRGRGRRPPRPPPTTSIAIGRPSSEYFAAFVSRFRTTCSTYVSSPTASGRPAPIATSIIRPDRWRSASATRRIRRGIPIGSPSTSTLPRSARDSTRRSSTSRWRRSASPSMSSSAFETTVPSSVPPF